MIIYGVNKNLQYQARIQIWSYIWSGYFKIILTEFEYKIVKKLYLLIETHNEITDIFIFRRLGI